MFVRVFLKEWKDNIGIFSLAVLFILALTGLSWSDHRELTVYFMGMFLLLFLPFAGLLIGSGGFYSEFKDNAWVYLFSRPIRKEKVWVFKFVSLLSLLAVIELIFLLAKGFLPGLGEIMQDFNVPGELRGLVSFSTYLVLPLLVFAIAFSLSMLYEKQFAVLFVAVLIGAGLVFLQQQYYNFLWTTYLYSGKLRGFQVLLVLSFMAASILTLARSDFSQTGKKVFVFSRYAAFFLVLSFAFATVWIARGNLFSGKKALDPFDSREYSGDVYFGTYTRGIIKYGSGKDSVGKIGRVRSFFPRFSIEAEKIAFFSYPRSKRKWSGDLWVMNTDGTEEKALIESYRPESPLHGLNILPNCLLSPDGRKVAFVAAPDTRNIVGTSASLWWLNTGGSGLKSQVLGLSRFHRIDLFAWSGSENSLIIGIAEKPSTYRVLVVDLDTGSQQTLFEHALTSYHVRVSPGQESLALWFLDEPENRPILAVLDLGTLEKKIIYKPDPGGWAGALGTIRWSRDGDKVAFSKKNEVFVYSLSEEEMVKTFPRANEFGANFDWLSGDDKFALICAQEGKNFLKVFSRDFREEKTIRIPEFIEAPRNFWGLDNRVLLYDSGKEKLWRVDVISQKWKNVY
jgi:hypothetical protein